MFQRSFAHALESLDAAPMLVRCIYSRLHVVKMRELGFEVGAARARAAVFAKRRSRIGAAKARLAFEGARSGRVAIGNAGKAKPPNLDGISGRRSDSKRKPVPVQ